MYVPAGLSLPQGTCSNCSQHDLGVKYFTNLQLMNLDDRNYATRLVNQVLLVSTVSSGEGTSCILGSKPTTRTKCGNNPLNLLDFSVGLF